MSLIAGLSACLAGLPGTSESGSDGAGSIKALASDEPVLGNVRFFGYLDVIREPADNSQELDARFGQFAADVPASVVHKAFSLETPDTCERSSRSEPIEIVDELAFPGHPYRLVDAGDAITIRHKNRRYASLSRTPSEDGPVYETAVAGAAATFAKIKLFNVFVRTENLTASIPGAVFPKTGPLKIPPVSEVSGFNLSEEDRVSADTVFRWDAGSDAGAIVQISAGGGGRAIFCSLVDDGEFALPEDIQQWLGNKTIPRPEAHRESVVFYQVNGALIAVSQSTQY
ncbi:MAG: hypothetical protein AB8C46_02960 [Burkholderiaceae bacterium]